VNFEHCYGPIQFEDCDEFRNTRFAEVTSRQIPAWVFTHCHFAADSRLEQDNVPCNEKYGPIADFDHCTCDSEPARVLVGPELGQAMPMFTGLRTRTLGRMALPLAA
jgi:hypothetical protein